MTKVTAVSPKEIELKLQGYHRLMIPHVAFILDFDRAHEYYKDFQQITPKDAFEFSHFRKGHIRFYTCKLDVCPNDILEVKTLIEGTHDWEAYHQTEITKIISTRYYLVQDDYSLKGVIKNEMIRALDKKLGL